MPNYKGFWSYVRSDDAADGGRVIRLARDIAAEFEMQTGEVIELFLDRDELQWGDDWKDEVDIALASVAFFIPVLTPRYFQSAECRRELQYFARRATELGVRDLVLPLLYVDIPGFQQNNVSDDLMLLVGGFQWENWLDLRFADPMSEPYRRGVARLVLRLVAANMQAEESAATVDVPVPENLGDEPGLIDQLANAEVALPKWSETIAAMSAEIESIGSIMREATEEAQRLDRAGKGFAGRSYVANKTARQLAEPAKSLVRLGSTFAAQMYDIDGGFRALIQAAPNIVRANPEELNSTCEFLAAIRGAAAATETGLIEIEGMIRQASLMEGMSRDLRAPLRKMKKGLTKMLEARAVAREWVRLIDATGLDCPPPDQDAAARDQV